MVEALTPPRIDPIGHRRNHTKGICFMRELCGHPNANE
jgi:oxalate decarboxylase/phosphoglucose isomerase-like protein (cupin superfamily)